MRFPRPFSALSLGFSMKHGVLLSVLVLLLAGSAGGVFVLMRQNGQEQEIAEEPLMVSVSADAIEEHASSVQPSLAPPPEDEVFEASLQTEKVTPAPPPLPAEKININTANLEELDYITGVGPAIAQRIIDYRNQNGPFQTIEEIKNVSGIGDVNFEKMKDEITM